MAHFSLSWPPGISCSLLQLTKLPKSLYRWMLPLPSGALYRACLARLRLDRRRKKATRPIRIAAKAMEPTEVIATAAGDVILEKAPASLPALFVAVGLAVEPVTVRPNGSVEMLMTGLMARLDSEKTPRVSTVEVEKTPAALGRVFVECLEVDEAAAAIVDLDVLAATVCRELVFADAAD